MYEALYHLLIQQMEAHYRNGVWNNQFIGEAKSKIEEAFPFPSSENFTAFQDSQEFRIFYRYYKILNRIFKKMEATWKIFG